MKEKVSQIQFTPFILSEMVSKLMFTYFIVTKSVPNTFLGESIVYFIVTRDLHHSNLD